MKTAAPPRFCIVQHTLSGYNVPLFVRLGHAAHGNAAVFAGAADGEGARRLPELLEAMPATRVLGSSRFNRWLRAKTRFTPPSWRILFAVWRFRPRVVYVDGLSSAGTALALGALMPLWGARLVWWSLGAIPGRRMDRRTRIGDFLQWLATRSAVVLAYGEHGAAYFRRLGVPEDRLVVGCNTIDEEEVFASIETARSFVPARRAELRLAEGAPVIVYCGGLNSGKRVDVLLRALASVAKERPRSPVLLLIGDGDQRPELEALTATLGLTDRVRFLGARGADEVSQFFLLGQFAVLPGLGGLAIPHAFAHGLPVICGPADGMEQQFVLDGETGILLREVSPSTLAEAMIRLLERPEEVRRMGAAARDLVATRNSIRSYCRLVQEAGRRALQR